MTRTGSAKRVDAGYAMGRLKKAVAFHGLVALAAEHPDRILDADVIHTNIVLALIAYTDAITAAFAGVVNQKDHMAAVKLLRDTLGKALPDVQERRLVRLLGRKDEMSYGARMGKRDEAQQAVENLEAFATWAREKLTERGIAISTWRRAAILHRRWRRGLAQATHARGVTGLGGSPVSRHLTPHRSGIEPFPILRRPRLRIIRSRQQFRHGVARPWVRLDHQAPVLD